MKCPTPRNFVFLLLSPRLVLQTRRFLPPQNEPQPDGPPEFSRARDSDSPLRDLELAPLGEPRRGLPDRRHPPPPVPIAAACASASLLPQEHPSRDLARAAGGSGPAGAQEGEDRGLELGDDAGIGLGGLRRGRGRGRDCRGRGARALIACFLRRAAAPLLDRFLPRGFRCIDTASGPLRGHLDFKVQAEEEPREPSIEKKKSKKKHFCWSTVHDVDSLFSHYFRFLRIGRTAFPC